MAGKPIDLMGQRFGRLVVIERAGTSKNGQVIWRCLCDCGKEADVLSISLRRGLTRSCGCLSREKVSERTTARNTTHGARHTKLYNTWRGMRERCENPSHKSYSDYGGRGISVCAEWQDFTAFQKWALASGYKDGLSLDRIDSNGNYEPSNCRWADKKQQSRNRRSNHLITYKGQTKTAIEWAEQFHINRDTLAMRLKAGWSVEKALETPVESPTK